MGFDPVSLAVEAAVALSSIAPETGAAIATSTAVAGGEAVATGAALSPLVTGAVTGVSSGLSTLGALSYGAQALSLAGGVIGAAGAMQSAGAQAAADRYNAAVAAQNADQANRNANLAGEGAEAQLGIAGQKSKATVGAILAEQSASGLDVNSGSSSLVRQSAADMAQLNALTVRSNAIKEAYGYQTQAKSFQNESALDTQSARDAEKAGTLNAASTFLGGVGSAASNFAKWQVSSSKNDSSNFITF